MFHWYCVVWIGFTTVSITSTNIILLTGQSLHQMSYNNEVSIKKSCLLRSIPFSLDKIGLHSMMPGGCSVVWTIRKVCVHVLLSSIVVSEMIVPSSSFFYQQDKNDYNNKRIPFDQYSMGKSNWMKYLLTNKSAVENHQPAQESSHQETNGQTKMILSNEDTVKVVWWQRCVVLFKPNALKRVWTLVI
jgi:hypothetical protein